MYLLLLLQISTICIIIFFPVRFKYTFNIYCTCRIRNTYVLCTAAAIRWYTYSLVQSSRVQLFLFVFTFFCVPFNSVLLFFLAVCLCERFFRLSFCELLCCCAEWMLVLLSSCSYWTHKIYTRAHKPCTNLMWVCFPNIIIVCFGRLRIHHNFTIVIEKVESIEHQPGKIKREQHSS